MGAKASCCASSPDSQDSPGAIDATAVLCADALDEGFNDPPLKFKESVFPAAPSQNVEEKKPFLNEVPEADTEKQCSYEEEVVPEGVEEDNRASEDTETKPQEEGEAQAEAKPEDVKNKDGSSKAEEEQKAKQQKNQPKKRKNSQCLPLPKCFGRKGQPVRAECKYEALRNCTAEERQNLNEAEAPAAQADSKAEEAPGPAMMEESSTATPQEEAKLSKATTPEEAGQAPAEKLAGMPEEDEKAEPVEASGEAAEEAVVETPAEKVEPKPEEEDAKAVPEEATLEEEPEQEAVKPPPTAACDRSPSEIWEEEQQKQRIMEGQEVRNL